MAHIVIAAGSETTAAAGVSLAAMGGNAVDAAAAAVAASWVCEPGMTAVGSALLAMVRPADEQAMLVDGLTVMPGLGGHRGEPPGGSRITMPYGPGVETGVGPASVAVPGGPAALELLQQRWGRLSWAEVMAPAIRLAADGFPYPEVSALYLPISGECIYDLTEGGRSIWRFPDGRPRQAGDVTVLPELAADLQQIADEGASVLYTGSLGERIGDWLVEHGGALSRQDLVAYQPLVRAPRQANDHGWSVWTSDTIGGEALLEMVAGFAKIPPESEAEARLLVDVMATTLRRRDDRLRGASASTTQICAVDETGCACSVTTSTGYGSGVVVPGTGIMLNNMLGELELLPQGPHVLKPGERLPSNMTPMIAVRDESVVALGAAGADRIAPAIAQTWRGIVARRASVSAAVDAPRFHIRDAGGAATLDYEPGFDPAGVDLPLHPFDERHMYFGGVQAAALCADGSLAGGGDPRRGGATATCSS